MGKIVSIITPCYNGKDSVCRFLDSILNQTYKNIELIFINDGSTDCTEEIALHYIPVFGQQGMSLIYHKQPNAGQAAALNKGLQLFTGEYLAWIDSDDYLDNTSIEKRVAFLEKNPQYGFVRSNAYYVDFYTLKPVKRVAVLPRRFESHIFKGLIEEKQFILNGCYLVRTSAFLDVNPTRTIEFSFIGQNLQMLLPLSYKYLCGFIDETLFFYVNTPNSHSRVQRTYAGALARYNEFYRLLYSLCNKIKMPSNEKKEYNKLIFQYSIRAYRNLALEYKRFEDFKKYQSQYQSLHPSFFGQIIPEQLKYHTMQMERRTLMTLKNTIKHLIR